MNLIIKTVSAISAFAGIIITLFSALIMAFAPETVGLAPVLAGEALILAGALAYKAADRITA